MKHLLNTAKVPNGGLCRYVDPETGKSFSHPYYVHVRAWALKHRQVNNLPVPVNWEAWLQDQICQATPSCECEEEGGGAVAASLWTLAGRFGSAMAAWAASGFAFVSDEVREERRDICEGRNGRERCSNWQQSHGYFGFGRCAACGCRTGLKTAIAAISDCPKGKWLR